MSRRDELIARHSQKAGLRGKVNAMCISCIYDEVGGKGTWKQQIQSCTVESCPLWEVRAKSEGKSEA